MSAQDASDIHVLTKAGEDYLESIYRLSLDRGEGDKSVRSVDVAERLEVSKASVNKALSVLKEMGMPLMSWAAHVLQWSAQWAASPRG